MKFLLFIALVAVIYGTNVWGSALLGAKECTWGPSYWCQNLKSSKTCHATKHCIQTIWEHKKIEKPDTDSVCQICKDMVKQARDQLQSNETQEELKEVFEGSCKLIPVKIIAKECIKISDEFLPELVDTLASQMDPEVVCSVAGLCNNARFDKLLEREKQRNKVVEQAKVEVETTTSVVIGNKLSCDSCFTVAENIHGIFAVSKPHELLNFLLNVCNRVAGSYVDGCAAAVVGHFNEIQNFLVNKFTPFPICHFSGVCSEQYHHHENKSNIVNNVIVTANSGMNSGAKSDKSVDDNLTCDLCSQLVQQLRDILIANTTEEEFKNMLLGICKQTTSFKNECTDLVEEYYPVIYDTLTRALDPKAVCTTIGLCPGVSLFEVQEISQPLIPAELHDKMKEIQSWDEKSKVVKINERPLTAHSKPILNTLMLPESHDDTGRLVDLAHPKQPKLTTEELNAAQLPLNRMLIDPRPAVEVVDEQQMTEVEIQQAQLPIDRVMPKSLLGMRNGNLCAFCEYVLHYIQVEISSSKEEEVIKHAVENVCHKLPTVIGDECSQFIENYGEALIALFTQELDPDQICPLLSLCPRKDMIDVEMIAVDEKVDKSEGNKKNCPLCLFAVKELEDMVKDEKNEQTIEQALDKLCSHLPKELKGECDNFVEKYSKELVDMLIADLNPQEVCVYLKFCNATSAPTYSLHFDANELAAIKKQQEKFDSNEQHELITNEIFDNTLGGVKVQSLPQISGVPPKVPLECPICAKIVQFVESEIQGITNKDELKHIINGSCIIMPGTMKADCYEFMKKNLDLIVDILAAGVEPQMVCSYLALCSTQSQIDVLNAEVTMCGVCHETVESIYHLMTNPKIDQDMYHILHKACLSLPETYNAMCDDIINNFGKVIFNLIVKDKKNLPLVCKKIFLCGGQEVFSGMYDAIDDQSGAGYSTDKCYFGPSYWCTTKTIAKTCGEKALQYCQDNVWINKN